jgi:LemA protein
VQINNTRIEQFPAVLIARRYGFGPAQLLQFAAEEKGDVDVGALFGR